MSYSPLDARLEFLAHIEDAQEHRDVEKAIIIRDYYSEVGDDEQADYWNKLAKKWENEDWAHDRAADNQ